MWPYGDVHFSHQNLEFFLRNSATHHARSALDLFTKDDAEDQLIAAINVGCAVELLAKCYIASIEPTLLADRVDRESLLHLSGKCSHVSTAPTQIKTRGAKDTLLLAKHFYPALRFQPQATDELVFQVRNASAHMGIVEQGELRSAVLIMVRIVEDLIKALQKVDRVQFWGENRISLVDQFLDESASDLRRTVAAKVAGAQRQLERLVGGLSEEASRVVLSSLSGRPGRILIDHEQPQKCPVCEQMGWLVCTVERSDVETDYDEDGVHYLVHQAAYPKIFECPVCNLTLENQELDRFDFPVEIQLEPDTEPFEAYERDEDLHRDR